MVQPPPAGVDHFGCYRHCMKKAPPDTRLTVRLSEEQQRRLGRIAAAGVPKGRVVLEGLDARLCA